MVSVIIIIIIIIEFGLHITKTSLFKYIEKFYLQKHKIFR